MSGLKRPHPSNDEAFFSARSSAVVKRNRPVSHNSESTASQVTRSFERCDSHDTNYGVATQAHQLIPEVCHSSTSQYDPFEVPNSIASTWTPSTLSSSTDASESVTESQRLEICFGMVSARILFLVHSIHLLQE